MKMKRVGDTPFSGVVLGCATAMVVQMIMMLIISWLIADNVISVDGVSRLTNIMRCISSAIGVTVCGLISKKSRVITCMIVFGAIVLLWVFAAIVFFGGRIQTLLKGLMWPMTVCLVVTLLITTKSKGGKPRYKKMRYC